MTPPRRWPGVLLLLIAAFFGSYFLVLFLISPKRDSVSVAKVERTPSPAQQGSSPRSEAAQSTKVASAPVERDSSPKSEGPQRREVVSIPIDQGSSPRSEPLSAFPRVEMPSFPVERKSGDNATNNEEVSRRIVIQASSIEPPNPCADSAKCTLIKILFGTDRKFHPADLERDKFTGDRGAELLLGRAFITVPKSSSRRKGEIPRPNWWDSNVLRVPPEGDPVRHFTIPRRGIQVYENVNEFVVEMRNQYHVPQEFRDHTFIFIHGYGTTFEHALYRTAQIAYDLGADGEPFGTAHLYSWPSGGGLLDYKYDFDSARFAVEHLRKYLETVVGKTPARNVHLIAHSMGAWVLMKALEAWDPSVVAGRTINQVILAAPDIDVAEFRRLAAKIHTIAKGMTLYASSNDAALKASASVHRHMARAGFVSSKGPAITKGIDSIDISNIGTDVFSNGHSEYAARKEVLNDIALLLRKGERPPHARTPILERIRQSELEYWRYPK